MALFQLLLAGAMACGGVATLSAYAAWPRLRALEARGVVKTTVPDLLEGRTNSWRAGKLIWFTPIPADRKRLRRLLFVCRTAQIGMVALLFAAVMTPPDPSLSDDSPPDAVVVLKEPAR